MKGCLVLLAKLVLLGMLLTGLFWLSTWKYRECRQHGFSIWYCLDDK